MTCIRNAPSIASLWPGLSCLFPHLSLPTCSFAWCSSREHCPFPDSLNLLDFCLCFGLLVVGMCFMNGTYPSVVLFQPWGPYCCDPKSHARAHGMPRGSPVSLCSRRRRFGHLQWENIVSGIPGRHLGFSYSSCGGGLPRVPFLLLLLVIRTSSSLGNCPPASPLCLCWNHQLQHPTLWPQGKFHQPLGESAQAVSSHLSITETSSRDSTCINLDQSSPESTYEVISGVI